MAGRSERDMQSETDENIADFSDSGYSTGCSNSQSQRRGRSKSTPRLSGSKIIGSYEVYPPNGVEFTSPPAPTERECKKKEEQTATVQESDEADSMDTLYSGFVGNSSYDRWEGAYVKEGIPPPQSIQALTLLAVSKLVEPADTPKFLDSLQSKLFLVVSMHDGKVVYTTPNIIDFLGFPKNMWQGLSFINLMHVKDRNAFNKHIISSDSSLPQLLSSTLGPGKEMHQKGVAKSQTSVGSQVSANTEPSKSTFFCHLRKYRSLKTNGFAIKGKATHYLPFELSLYFKKACATSTEILMFITATAVETAYSRPEEGFLGPQFSTQLLSNCTFSHVDAKAVSYLGYLPKNIVGRCIFDFYHPEDVHLIKEMYEKVLENQTVAYRSKPCRFRTQNGGYALLETEWSAFVSPWSRKLEMTIGQHTVLKGPPNPNVFASRVGASTFSYDVVSESKKVQEGIKNLLNRFVPNRNSESSKELVVKRCRDLVLFIKTLLDENMDHNIEQSASVLESVLLGEMWPHPDARSNISSEAPPSSRQLNNKEKIQQYFENKPRTPLGSDDEN